MEKQLSPKAIKLRLTILALASLGVVIYGLLSSIDDRYAFIVIVFAVLFVVFCAGIIGESYLFQDIKCKVIDKDGRFRYTYVYRNKKKKIYKVHGKDGGWIILNENQIKMIEENRQKRTIHGGHVIPEFRL